MLRTSIDKGFIQEKVASILCDIGGTHLRLGVGLRDGEIIALHKTRITGLIAETPSSTTLRLIHNQVKQYLASVSELVPVDTPMVLTFPGPVDSQGRFLSAPTLVGSSRELPDIVQLSQEYGRRVYALNDLAAAAWHFGDTTPGRSMVVTVSSGIGAKIFDREHPDAVLDKPAFAEEIGHVVVDQAPDAPLCDCGARGHLGAIASGRGIERAARRRAAIHRDDFLASLCALRFHGTPETLTNEQHLVPAALASDPWTIGVIRENTRYLASVLATVFVAVGLSRIIIIGGFALAFPEIYLAILRDEFSLALTYAPAGDDLSAHIVMGRFAEEACLRGCLAFFLKRVARCG